MDGACRARERAPGRYQPRRPSQSVLYRCVQAHFETWLVQCRDGHCDAGPVPAYGEREFRRYLECGILAHGFARARCGQCGHDLPEAFSCKGRGVCPSCNTRRMVATAAHRTDHVLPRRGLLPEDAAGAMAQGEHGGGFSVAASVRIEAADRAGRARLLRYCARPPFASDRRRQLDPERLLHASAKPGPGGTAHCS